ncbi:hypothetical protein [Nocardia blacklockiae]|uniref:hypothetical protein n=1 Tax=Nocardia blacklockiae TaxID=480036 RepID=UPI001895FBB7|nr:hypothetical protein [Nocardia blacklockiae]MBF6173587.1 hypothetical protein [Nocardia blacklockiae]
MDNLRGDLVVTIALLVTVCFVCYLALCAVVVIRTGSTYGLCHVAQAIYGLRKALRFPV